MIRRVLSIFRRKITSEVSTLKAICSTLSAEELALLLQKAEDWRGVVDQAALIRSESIEQFGARVSKVLGIEFIQSIPAFDSWLLPKKFSIDSFRSVGAAPLFKDGILSGIVCVDPTRLGELGLTFASLPRKLSSWLAIEQALSTEKRALNPKSVEDRVSYVLSLVVAEALEYGANSVSLCFKEKGIEYLFLCRDGKRGQGSVAGSLKFPLLSRLGEALKSESQRIQIRVNEETEDFSVVAKSSSTYELERLCSVSPKIEPEPEVSALTSTLQPETKFNQALPQFHSTIALIDDDSTFSLVVAGFFERSGVRVLSFNDPRAALRELKSQSICPDAIVCDLHMPAMSGLDLLREIRAAKELPRIPFIILTSDEDSETEVRAVSTGVDAFVSKSDEPLLLAAYVQKFLPPQSKAA